MHNSNQVGQMHVFFPVGLLLIMIGLLAHLAKGDHLPFVVHPDIGLTVGQDLLSL